MNHCVLQMYALVPDYCTCALLPGAWLLKLKTFCLPCFFDLNDVIAGRELKLKPTLLFFHMNDVIAGRELKLKPTFVCTFVIPH